MKGNFVIPNRKERISKDFFKRDSVAVARSLLGRVLVSERENQSPLYLQLTEIAAYQGTVNDDIERAKKKYPLLFYAPGIIGVSTIYGKHITGLGTEELISPSCITFIGGNLYDRRGLREHLQGSGKISDALGIDTRYNNTPIDFGKLWIGGESVNTDQVKVRKRLNIAENCKGYFYFR